MASARNASLNGGPGDRGVQGRAPGGGHGAKPPEAESFFVNFYTKSGQKLRTEMKTCPVSNGDCFAQP